MTSALFDSVFGSFRYSDAPDLMPIDEIIGSMDAIELATLKAMNDATRSAVKRLKKEAQGKSLSEIAKLNWDLAPDIAKTLNVTWDKGYKSGSKDAIKELRAAIPQKYNSSQYAKVADLIKQLFDLKPFSAFDSGRPKASVKAILSRNLKIAGDYSKEILERVKNNLSQSMIVQPGTGYPMPPKQVNALIQDTLNVSQARAATISRTETTNAYSQSRVETFKQSSLATHCRFLAIADDRVTDICRTRNGIVFPISEESKYRPALHFNCFPKGTKILMGDGTEQNIETVKIGDSVKVATTSVMQKVYNVITSRFTGNLREIVLEDGKTIVCTPDHPIWDGQTFAKASDIRIGQALWIDNCSDRRQEVQTSCEPFQNITPLRVAKIKDIPFDGIVYNLSVENDEIYFANGILVHNCRSTISVLLPKINPQHQKMIDDPNLDPNNRVLAPLLVGWR